MHRTIVRQAVMCVAETWAVRKTNRVNLDVAGMRREEKSKLDKRRGEKRREEKRREEKRREEKRREEKRREDKIR